MWRYTRRLSLTDRPMTLRFSNHVVKLNADGVVISEVSDALRQQFEVNSAFIYEAKSEPKPVAEPAKVEPQVEAIKEKADCDTIEKPKSSRKRASSRSRRKSSSDKQD